MVFVEISDEFLQAYGLLPEVSRWSNQLLKLVECYTADATYVKNARAAQIAESMLDVLPACVLGEEGANNHLKARARRPPVQRAIGISKRPIDAAYLS